MHSSNAIARALDMKRDPPSVRGVKRTVDLNIVQWAAQDVRSISCRTSAGSEYSYKWLPGNIQLPAGSTATLAGWPWRQGPRDDGRRSAHGQRSVTLTGGKYVIMYTNHTVCSVRGTRWHMELILASPC